MYLISFRHWLAARNLTTLLCVVLKRHHIRYGQRTYLPATSVSGVCVKLLIPAFVHSSANHQIYIFPVIKERLLDSKKEGDKRGDGESYKYIVEILEFEKIDCNLSRKLFNILK